MGMAPVPAGAPPNTTLAFVLSIITTLLCCLPGGLFCIYLTNQAKTAAIAGDYAGARSKLTIVYIVCPILMVLGGLVNIGWIFGNAGASYNGY